MSPSTARKPRKAKSCHERALGLLATRPRSRRELERRLVAAGFERQEVEDTLARLERVKLLDDEAFAGDLAAHAAGVRHEGIRAIRHRLASKGVSPSLIASVVDELAVDEEARAERLALARAARLEGLEPRMAFVRLSAHLMRRGYSPEVARRAAGRALSIDTS